MNCCGCSVWHSSFEEFDNASAEQHGCVYCSSLNPAENSPGEFLKRRRFHQAVPLVLGKGIPRSLEIRSANCLLSVSVRVLLVRHKV